MTRTTFSLSPSAAPDDLTALMFGIDDDEDMGRSPPATDIFQPGGVGLFDEDLDDEDPLKGELSFDEPIVRGISLIVLSSVEGVCCGKVGTMGSKVCFREFTDAVPCPVTQTKQKFTLELSQPTLFRVDGGAASTILF